MQWINTCRNIWINTFFTFTYRFKHLFIYLSLICYFYLFYLHIYSCSFISPRIHLLFTTLICWMLSDLQTLTVPQVHEWIHVFLNVINVKICLDFSILLFINLSFTLWSGVRAAVVRRSGLHPTGPPRVPPTVSRRSVHAANRNSIRLQCDDDTRTFWFVVRLWSAGRRPAVPVWPRPQTQYSDGR